MPRKQTAVPHVYAGDTSTSVANSKAEVERLLVRYGASAFAVTHDYAGGALQVAFRIPDSAQRGAAQVPVQIPVSIKTVYAALYGDPPTNRVRHEKQMLQAERVAWRNLVLWLTAALATATIGLQTVTEAFFAHARLGPNGERVIDWAWAALDPSRQLPGGRT
jgi:hypothetical protein